MRKLTRRQRLSAIALSVLAACFITLDLGGGSLREAHTGVRGTLGGLYRGTDALLGPARRWLEGVPSAGTNQARIEQLRREVARLNGELAKQAADRHTEAQLAGLQRASDGSDHTLLPARVIALGPGQGFDWTVTLDVGSRGGVQAGQTVTDGAGLVGRVLQADSDSSVVLLAADPGSGVGVRDVRSGEIGVASGAGPSGFLFVPLSPTARIEVGDRLVSGPSGASSYIAGLSVGTVTAVRTSADGTVRASVRPATSPTAVDLVAVILDPGATVAGRAPLRPGR
ncbi:MAG TPA: rod shape-determining protein MreC [Jatrophihabitans sp.]|jgi:rod shape-determining protein MreC|uniref:rod shape-determining protein MreC n=1 Tax=Jatrophihabitans sp. TaxID=1932789 RepID=UPI002DFED298|nr:rod shape-determining protein MreC [Jatrophihabitans sp.]